MVVHLISLAFTGFILYQAVPGSDLFSWHPTCMAVSFTLLVLQAIVIFSPESGLFTSSSRPDKVQLHWILHLLGLFSTLFGFAVVFLNKEINDRKHFVSWHGKFGLATTVGAVLVALGGIFAKYSTAEWMRKLSRPVNTKMYHATAGMMLYLLAMSTVALACYSNWFKNRVGKGWAWRVCFWCPIVLAVCVARQVTQNYLPRVLTPRESKLDEKQRIIQDKIDAKLKRKASKSSGSSDSERKSD